MKDVVVIGAGPGGLVTTKELYENGITNIVCLEKQSDIGGVYLHSYENLTLTSSCLFSMFSDYWVGDDQVNHFWHKSEVIDYWRSYVSFYKIEKFIQFNTEVLKTEYQDSHWKLWMSNNKTLKAKSLVVATGNNRYENLPKWAHQLTNIHSLHSKDYINSKIFTGKRVVVIGGGESASDITLEISKVAEQTYVSIRNTTGWILPRMRGMQASDLATHRSLYGIPRNYGRELSKQILDHEISTSNPVNSIAAELNSKIESDYGIWGTYGTKCFSLPQAIANYGCKLCGEITAVEDGGKTLVPQNGEVINDIDIVLFCTGYKTYLPFLPLELQNIDPRSLFKHMYHPDFGISLSWVGLARPGFGSQFPIMEMQARYYALITAGVKSLPSKEKMKQQIRFDADKNLSQFGHNAQRIRNLVDYHHYMDDMAKDIGCFPPLWKLFFVSTRAWLAVVFGPTQATQYRLCGPGSKRRESIKILNKIPYSRFNHVVKAGVKGRFSFLVKRIITALRLHWHKA